MDPSITDPLEIVRTLRERTGRDFYSNVLEKTNWRDVQLSWKEACYIGDWSFMPDLHVEGPDAMELFADLCVNSFDDFPVGTAKQAVMCNHDGKTIGDSVLMRVDDETFHHQNIAPWTMYHALTGEYDVEVGVNDSFIYQVQGPNALAVLESVTDADLRGIDFMHFETIDLAGHEVDCLRQGMSGEIGFELHGPRAIGQVLFENILEVGEPYGIRHLVGRTRLINHLESCFPTAGLHYLPAIYEPELRPYREWLADYDEGRDWTPWSTFNAGYAIEGSYEGEQPSDWYCSPIELGWERNIAFDHDFIGREALEAESAEPRRTMVTLEWEPDDVIEVFRSLFEHGTHNKYMELPYKPIRTLVADEVSANGRRVGMSSGRGYSYYFRRMLSLCSIDVEYAEPGTEVTVIWGEGAEPQSPAVQPHEPAAIRATVAPAPYKEDRRRVDLASV